MGQLFGPNLLQHLLLALSLALVVGNGLALLRPPPPEQRGKGDLRRAPVTRSIVMMVIGAIVAIWVLVSLA